MNFVLDNSVTMRWFFEDGSRSDLAYADKVLASMAQWGAMVPVTWGLEVANVFARAEAQKQVTTAESGIFIEMLKGLDIEVDTETFEHAFTRVLQLARVHNLSSYDASYLELAIRQEIPLATLDKGLKNAAKKTGVKLAPRPS